MRRGAGQSWSEPWLPKSPHLPIVKRLIGRFVVPCSRDQARKTDYELQQMEGQRAKDAARNGQPVRVTLLLRTSRKRCIGS